MRDYYGKCGCNCGSRLVLDGRRFDDQWMVRKYDTTPHVALTQGVGILKDLGVKGEFKKLEKKGWLMSLSFDSKAGGAEAIRALKRYVTALAETYGEPLYAGNTRYKGEAIERFLRADMAVLAD